MIDTKDDGIIYFNNKMGTKTQIIKTSQCNNNCGEARKYVVMFTWKNLKND